MGSRHHRSRRWGLLLPLLSCVLLLLSGCGEEGRIRTKLTPGEHVAHVELSDGHLEFFEEEILKERSQETTLSYAHDHVTLRTYAQVVEELGFDPGAATAQLPEHLQLGEQSYDMDANATRFEPREGYPDGMVYGGYKFWRSGEKTGLITPWLQLKVCRADAVDSMFHTGYLSFRVYPWVRLDPEADQEFPEEYLAYRPSQVGDVTVGALHFKMPVHTPGTPNGKWEYYYAGFYVGDLAFALHMQQDYCTQEEFIQVLLALIDGAIAQGVGE